MKLELGNHDWDFDEKLHKIFPDFCSWKCKKCKITYEMSSKAHKLNDVRTLQEWSCSSSNKWFSGEPPSCEEVLMHEALR